MEWIALQCSECERVALVRPEWLSRNVADEFQHATGCVGRAAGFIMRPTSIEEPMSEEVAQLVLRPRDEP